MDATAPPNSLPTLPLSARRSSVASAASSGVLPSLTSRSAPPDPSDASRAGSSSLRVPRPPTEPQSRLHAGSSSLRTPRPLTEPARAPSRFASKRSGARPPPTAPSQQKRVDTDLRLDAWAQIISSKRLHQGLHQSQNGGVELSHGMQLWGRSKLAMKRMSTQQLRPRLRARMEADRDHYAKRDDHYRQATVVKCDTFDVQYYHRSARAERIMLDITSSPPSAPLATDRFYNGLWGVQATRFVGPPRPKKKPDRILEDGQGVSDEAAPEAPPEIFDPYKSIWQPRAEWADSRALLDTEDAELRRFTSDWERMLGMGITKVVLRSDDDSAEDADGDGIPDEVVEVQEVLWRNHAMICLLFAYYASQGSNNKLDTLSYNEWNMFVKDQKLVTAASSYTNTQGEIDLLFHDVHASAPHTRARQAHANGMMRPVPMDPCIGRAQCTARATASRACLLRRSTRARPSCTSLRWRTRRRLSTRTRRARSRTEPHTHHARTPVHAVPSAPLKRRHCVRAAAGQESDQGRHDQQRSQAERSLRGGGPQQVPQPQGVHLRARAVRHLPLRAQQADPRRARRSLTCHAAQCA